jgi:hypothetical protein
MTEDSEPYVGTEILTFYDEVAWVACWVRKDIVAQGPTEEVAIERLIHVIAMHCLLDGKGAREPLSNIPTPDSKTISEWRIMHELCHSGCHSVPPSKRNAPS